MNEISTILADYCTLLAQLNNDVWKNFIANYTADIFGLADIKTVTAAQVNEVLDTGEKIIVALCDKDKADELIEEMGTEAQEQLSDWFFNKYKDFVKKNVPNGDKFVGAADEFEKAYNKLEKYIQRLNQYAELIKNNASEEEQNKRKSDAEKAYDQFYAAYTAFEDLVNAL